VNQAPPIPGTYQHFKGGKYRVIGTATHSETKEPMVIYTPLYNDSGLWVRPLAMFTEAVIDAHENVIPRFRRIGD
jgi:hypothetical protein